MFNCLQTNKKKKKSIEFHLYEFINENSFNESLISHDFELFLTNELILYLNIHAVCGSSSR